MPPLWILVQLLRRDLVGVVGTNGTTTPTDATAASTTVGAQLLLFLALGMLGHIATHRLIPGIKHYMLKAGISGKDLGKKGTKIENVDM